MAFAYFDRVKESSTTTGTGVFTLAGAMSGFQAFSAVYANTDTLHYVIFQASTGAWEVGFGTWLTGNQLQRTTVLASSNAGALVNFAAGSKEVFVTEPASIPSRQGARFFTVADVTARDAVPATTLRLGALCRLISTGLFYHWTGSAWTQFRGFMPTVGAAGATIISDGTDWVAGPLDLADPDSHTGALAAVNGGTGIAGAGGTANRVLGTTNGSTWAAMLVSLTTMVTGLLPAANLPDGSAASVFGRSAATVGVQGSIASSADGQVLRRAAGVLGFGAVDLADADAVTGLLPLANLTGGSAVGQVLRNTTGNVPAWGAVDLADPDAVTGLLPFANIANGAATSVLGRSAGTAGVMASIAASVDGHVLQRVGGSLVFAAVGSGGLSGGTAVGQVLTNAVGNVPTWGAVDLADADAVTGLLPLANLSSLAGLSVLGRSTNTAGVMAAITGAADTVLRVNPVGSAVVFGTLVTGNYTDSSVTIAKLANGSASSVLGRSAATVGPYADIASSADGQVLRRGASGVIGFGAVDLADADAVTGLLPFANIANGTATSVFGRSTATAGVQASIAATVDGQVLQRVAGVLSFATLPPASVDGGTAVGQVLTNALGNVPTWGAVDLADADAVTGLLPLANLSSLAAYSVLGRAGTTTGVMAAITAAADGQVLRRVSTTNISFGTLATTSYTDGSVTLAKLANGTASSVLGRSPATAGVYADITSSADGQVLRRGSAGVIGFGAVDLADPDAVTGVVPAANLPDGLAASVFGRATSTAGDQASIASSADGQVLRRASGVVGFGALDLADPDAVTGLLPGTNVNPNFGSQNITSTGLLTIGTAAAVSVRMPNTAILSGVNALGTGDIALAYVESDNYAVYGSTGGSGVRFVSSGGMKFEIAGSTALLGNGVNTFLFNNSTSAATLLQNDNSASATPTPTLTIRSARGLAASGVGANGGGLDLIAGAGVVNDGTLRLLSGAQVMLSAAYLSTGAYALGLLGDVTTTKMPANSGSGVLYINNAASTPTTGNPVAGYSIFGDATGLYVRGPSGSVNQIGLP